MKRWLLLGLLVLAVGCHVRVTHEMHIDGSHSETNTVTEPKK
jgi:hypothetical protein